MICLCHLLRGGNGPRVQSAELPAQQLGAEDRGRPKEPEDRACRACSRRLATPAAVEHRRRRRHSAPEQRHGHLEAWEQSVVVGGDGVRAQGQANDGRAEAEPVARARMATPAPCSSDPSDSNAAWALR